MNRIALDVARAMAETITGFHFDDLLESQQAELVKAAKAAMACLEDNREPLDPMRGVDFPFAENH